MIVPRDASPSVQQAFQDINRVLAKWTGVGNVDLHGRKFLNGGAPVALTDFVRLQDLQDAIAAIPPPTTDDAAKSDLVIFDSHANRVNYAAEQYRDHLYVEGDRLALYGSCVVDGVRTWKLLASQMVGSSAGRPGDLSTYDEGFTFRQMDSDHGTVVWHWSGALWHYVSGLLKGVIADIPAAADALIGAQYYATDFDRMYLTDGNAWADAPGQPKRGVQFFDGNPGTGWALCDGSTVTISTSTGGTTTHAVPDLVTVNRFVRSASSAGGTGGAATVDPPSTTSGVPSATTTVDNDGAASTVAVASNTHTHAVDLAALAILPPYYNLIPFFRL